MGEKYYTLAMTDGHSVTRRQSNIMLCRDMSRYFDLPNGRQILVNPANICCIREATPEETEAERIRE